MTRPPARPRGEASPWELTFHCGIADLSRSSDPVVILVPPGTDFEQAAAMIAAAQDAERR